jgi:hypothetical protein
MRVVAVRCEAICPLAGGAFLPVCFESFARLFRRESFSSRGLLRGEKVAKPDEGPLTPPLRSCDVTRTNEYACETPPHPPVGTFSPARNRGGEGLSTGAGCRRFSESVRCFKAAATDRIVSESGLLRCHCATARGVWPTHPTSVHLRARSPDRTGRTANHSASGQRRSERSRTQAPATASADGGGLPPAHARPQPDGLPPIS